MNLTPTSFTDIRIQILHAMARSRPRLFWYESLRPPRWGTDSLPVFLACQWRATGPEGHSPSHRDPPLIASSTNALAMRVYPPETAHARAHGMPPRRRHFVTFTDPAFRLGIGDNYTPFLNLTLHTHKLLRRLPCSYHTGRHLLRQFCPAQLQPSSEQLSQVTSLPSTRSSSPRHTEPQFSSTVWMHKVGRHCTTVPAPRIFPSKSSTPCSLLVRIPVCTVPNMELLFTVLGDTLRNPRLHYRQHGSMFSFTTSFENFARLCLLPTRTARRAFT